ncbi:NADP-dependent oxidoreductase YfmJ [Phlyctema vagabunda]|uniref:NADP-dependent oxidoreductase YfmJ n=1 Tax=Phlyctema vagabunda TaxID=108571 RepID=A0ABR4PY94_9HELO
MAQSTYKSVVLAKRPVGEVVPGQTFSIKENPALSEADIKDGQVLIQIQYLSLDPVMRAWISDIPSGMPPVQLGEVMRGFSVAKILASKASGLNVGAYVNSSAGWTEFAIVDSKDVTPLHLPEAARVTDALGTLGFSGLTAYFGILSIGKVKAGDFVVVSGAAGATGSIVCQIAKLKGATVLAIAGSAEKVQWLKEIGVDHALNYKDADFADQFHEKTAGLIDVYFDCVGGEILDLALGRAKMLARFVMCGAISQYNSPDDAGVKVLFHCTRQRILGLITNFRIFGKSTLCASKWKGFRFLTSHLGSTKRSQSLRSGCWRVSFREERPSSRVA